MFVAGSKQDEVKLGLFLRRQGLSASLLKSVKYLAGGLLVNEQPAKTNRLLVLGDVVQVCLPEEEAEYIQPEAGELDILFESRHAMVVNKPPGLVMHPTLSHKEGTLANRYMGHLAAKGKTGVFRPIGRLDADTSGLVLCAMNAFAAPVLAGCYRKIYLALAEGEIPLGRGRIQEPLGCCADSAIKQQVRGDGKEAVTDYEVLESAQGASLVAVWPKTGRTHQIRAHFSYRGWPLLGDWLYGGSRDAMKRHGLHCAGLKFVEPDQGELLLLSELPQDMTRAAALFGLEVNRERFVNSGLFNEWTRF